MDKPIEELIAEMKAAAEKAGCEQWQARKGFSGVEVIVKGSVAKGRGCVSFQPVATDLADDKTAKTVALFSPANVMSLIAALERSQQKADVYDMLREDYGLCEKSVGLADFVDRQAKRIAELEAASVKPLPIGELLQRLEVQTHETWVRASEQQVTMPTEFIEMYGTKFYMHTHVVEAILAAGGTVEGSDDGKSNFRS